MTTKVVLPTLSAHDQQRREEWLGINSGFPEPTGIACDECDAELVNPLPNCFLTTNPPLIRVECPECGFTGTALA